MKLKKIKVKMSKKEKTNLILFLLFCVITLSLSVGYAALNEELNISGEATFRVKEDIRIANVSLSETTNMGLENYTNKYGKDSITLGVGLPNIDSTVTYKVEIINSGSVSMWIDSITQELNNNTNMEYTLEGIGIKELINPGETKEFNLTIKYKEGITLPSNTNLDTMLRFNFVRPISTLTTGSFNQDADEKFFRGTLLKSSVETITFAPTLEVSADAIGYWDASLNKDGTVIAWYTDKDNNDLYELTIGGVGEVYAPSNSHALFARFTKLKLISFGEYFNTSKVTNMYRMFNDSTSLVSLDVSNFNTSKVTDMKWMFGSQYSNMKLSKLDLNNFDTSKVTDMTGMFYNCSSLVNLEISSFNTSNVTNMLQMFTNCSKLTKLDVSNFDTTNVTSMALMFSRCYALTYLDVSNFNTSKVGSMDGMFNGCSSLTELNVSNFDTSNVYLFGSVNGFGGMFSGCSKLTKLDLSNFDTSKAADMRKMFYGCSSLLELDISEFNTLRVTNMSHMFYNCNKLTKLDVSTFDTSKVTDMTGMFYNCSKLTYLNLSNFVTSNVKSFSSVTSVGTYYAGMFKGCSSLIELDISKFEFDNATTYNSMFDGINENTNIYVKNQDAVDFINKVKSGLNLIIKEI